MVDSLIKYEQACILNDAATAATVAEAVAALQSDARTLRAAYPALRDTATRLFVLEQLAYLRLMFGIAEHQPFEATEQTRLAALPLPDSQRLRLMQLQDRPDADQLPLLNRLLSTLTSSPADLSTVRALLQSDPSRLTADHRRQLTAAVRAWLTLHPSTAGPTTLTPPVAALPDLSELTALLPLLWSELPDLRADLRALADRLPSTDPSARTLRAYLTLRDLAASLAA